MELTAASQQSTKRNWQLQSGLGQAAFQFDFTLADAQPCVVHQAMGAWETLWAKGSASMAWAFCKPGTSATGEAVEDFDFQTLAQELVPVTW